MKPSTTTSDNLVAPTALLSIPASSLLESKDFVRLSQMYDGQVISIEDAVIWSHRNGARIIWRPDNLLFCILLHPIDGCLSTSKGGQA